MTSRDTRPIIKQIEEVERHISNREQAIKQLQKQYDIPAEWFSEDFNAGTQIFETDVEKSVYEQISRYHSDIRVYLNKIGLTREVLKSISNQIATGEADAENVKARVVEEHLELVDSLAKNVWNNASGVEFSDVIQDGTIGLGKAIDNFDYERGFQFKTYAQWWVRQSVVRCMATNRLDGKAEFCPTQ